MTNEMNDDLKIWLFVSHDFPQHVFLLHKDGGVKRQPPRDASVFFG